MKWFNKIFPCDLICHLVASVVALLVLWLVGKGRPRQGPPPVRGLGVLLQQGWGGARAPSCVELRGCFRPSGGASRGAAPAASARASLIRASGAPRVPRCAVLVRAELKSLSPPVLTRSPSAVERGTGPGTSSQARGSFLPHTSSWQRASL